MTCEHKVGTYSGHERSRIRGNNFDIITWVDVFECADCSYTDHQEFIDHEYHDEEYMHSDKLSRYTL